MRLGVTQFEKPRSSVGCIEQHDPAKRDQIDTSSKRETTRHRRVGASRLVKWHVLMPQGGSRRSDRSALGGRSALGAAVRSWTNCAPGRTESIEGALALASTARCFSDLLTLLDRRLHVVATLLELAQKTFGR